MRRTSLKWKKYWVHIRKRVSSSSQGAHRQCGRLDPSSPQRPGCSPSRSASRRLCRSPAASCTAMSCPVAQHGTPQEQRTYNAGMRQHANGVTQLQCMGHDPLLLRGPAHRAASAASLHLLRALILRFSAAVCRLTWSTSSWLITNVRSSICALHEHLVTNAGPMHSPKCAFWECFNTSACC